MIKDVIISITGLQYAQGENGSEDVQLIAPGQYYFKNGSHYLMYDEVDELSEDVYKNIIKFKPEYVEVTKEGPYNSKLVFETNKKTLSQYETPMGLMYIGISTRSIKLKEEPDSILLQADYIMDINNNFIADCSVSLVAKNRDAGIKLTS